MTDDANTEAAKTASTAFNALKVDWYVGGVIESTIWFSDITRTVDGQEMFGRVTAWGNSLSRLDTSGTLQVDLDNSDSYFTDTGKAIGLRGHVVTLYQIWEGLPQEDWVIIWKGVTEGKLAWAETNSVYTMTCVDYGFFMKAEAITIVKREDFPQAAPNEFGLGLPMVYGDARAVPAVWVQGGGPVTELARRLKVDDINFKVVSSAGFPQINVLNPVFIDVWVGRELIRGFFIAGGNLFTINERDLAFARVLFKMEPDNAFKITTTGLNKKAGYYQGFAVKLKIYNHNTEKYEGPFQYRNIVKHEVSGGTTTFTLAVPFARRPPYVKTELQAKKGLYPYKLTADRAAATEIEGEITTEPYEHARGTIVRYAGYRLSGAIPYSAKFIVSDRPCEEISRVYIKIDNQRFIVPKEVSGQSTYVENTNDPEYFGILGHNVSTIELRLTPELIRAVIGRNQYSMEMLDKYTKDFDEMAGHEITADIISVYAGTPSILQEHPADVIRHICIHRGGFTSAQINEQSIIDAKAFREDFKCSFHLRDPNMTTREIVEEIAKQAAMSIDWTEGKLKLVPYREDLDTATVTVAITDANRMIDSHALSNEGILEIATRITGKYIDIYGIERTETVDDTGAIVAQGIQADEIDFWSYPDYRPVIAALDIWLYLRRYPVFSTQVSVFLDNLSLLPGDVITFNGDRGWVQEVLHVPGSAGAGIIDHTELTLAIPISSWFDGDYDFSNPAYPRLPVLTPGPEDEAEEEEPPMPQDDFDDFDDLAVDDPFIDDEFDTPDSPPEDPIDTPEWVDTPDSVGDPSSNAPSLAAPSSEAPSSAAPSPGDSDFPSSDAPSSDALSSDVPSSDNPSSDVPSSDAPSDLDCEISNDDVGEFILACCIFQARLNCGWSMHCYGHVTQKCLEPADYTVKCGINVQPVDGIGTCPWGPGDPYECDHTYAGFNACDWVHDPPLCGTSNNEPTPWCGYEVTSNCPSECTNATITPEVNALDYTQHIGETFDVVADEGCEWSIMSEDGWITITDNGDGDGNGTIIYDVSENGGEEPRIGHIAVNFENTTVRHKVCQQVQ